MLRDLLTLSLPAGFDLYERRPGDYQLIVPIVHEDGDMLDIYLTSSPKGEEYVRICDFGLTLMRLSYTFNVETDTRRQILKSILVDNKISDEDENFFLDAPIGALYEGVLQFAGCVQKVCNMRYWSRETIRGAFYEDLEENITTDLNRFSPVSDYTPLSDYPIVSVDWALTYNSLPMYIFGVLGGDKAKSVAISLLEFQKAELKYISLVVHEDMENLGRKEVTYLTRNADKQYPALLDFKVGALADIERFSSLAV